MSKNIKASQDKSPASKLILIFSFFDSMSEAHKNRWDMWNKKATVLLAMASYKSLI
jgi:hypothetical protein